MAPIDWRPLKVCVRSTNPGMVEPSCAQLATPRRQERVLQEPNPKEVRSHRSCYGSSGRCGRNIRVEIRCYRVRSLRVCGAESFKNVT